MCVASVAKAVDSPIGSDDVMMVDGRTDRSRLACVCVELALRDEFERSERSDWLK